MFLKAETFTKKSKSKATDSPHSEKKEALLINNIHRSHTSHKTEIITENEDHLVSIQDLLPSLQP